MAATVLGTLSGQGALDRTDCIGPLLRAAYRSAPARDRSGLRARLLHAFADSAADAARARLRAEAAVRGAVRRRLAAPGASSAALRDAARAAGRPVLAGWRAEAIAAAELAACLRRGRRA